jgi:serine/threonine protein kinase
MIGQEIGNYRVLAQIGQGGMGAVYLAEHKEIGRRVAVKVILPELSSRPEVLARFFNEARATAQLRHPALVDVFDYGRNADGSAYIMMDYLEGDSLGARLARVGRMQAGEAARILRQIAEGVGVAHGAKIVHRDLKPDNIFLVPHPATGEDQVKILDFGIAKMLDAERGSDEAAQTRTGVMIGTPLFMAPEQCRGAGLHLIDHRADIYSVGGIAYRMLAGRPPFEYAGFGELIGAHLHENPAPLRSIEPSVPERFEVLVAKALAKRPEDRQQSMVVLVAELDVILAGLSSPGLGGTAPRSTMVLPAAAASLVAKASSPTPVGTRSGGNAPVAAPQGLRTQVLDPAGGPTERRSKTTLTGATGEVASGVRPAAGKSRALLVGAAAAILVGVGGLAAMMKRSPEAPSAARPVYVEPPRPLPRSPEPIAPAPAPLATPSPPHTEAPTKVVAPTPAREPSESHRASEHGSEPRSSATHAHTIRIAVTNAPEQLTVLVDGRPARLPLRLPLDSRSHVLRFESARTRPETRTISADKDQTVELANKPKLLLE